MQIDLSRSEQREYAGSLHKTILDLAQRKKPSGAAWSVSQAIAAKSEESLGPNEFFIPLDALRTSRELNTRGLSAGVENLRGYLVGTDLSPLEQSLRPASVLINAGARIVQLQGNMALRREQSIATAAWYHESDQISENTSEAFGQLTLMPHRCSLFTITTRQLQFQTDPDASDILVESMRASIGSAIDKAGLQGSGIVEPLGIIYTPGINTVTHSGATTWANLCSYESKITAANGDDASISFVGSPAVREKLRATAKLTNGSDTLWDSNEDRIGTHRAFVTSNMTATGLVAADFTKFVIALWGAAVATVDPYSSKRSEKIELVVTQNADCGIIWPLSACVNSGSVVQ
jgi:HK97 family phage major capsid protein